MRPAVQLQQQVRVCLEISWCAGKVRMPGGLRRGRIRHNHLTLHAAKHGDAGAESRADTSFGCSSTGTVGAGVGKGLSYSQRN